jgi:hypothetical protein
MPSAEITSRHGEFWANEVDRLEAMIASLRNDIGIYNQVLSELRSGELTWDRVQILETGQLKVLSPPPADTGMEKSNGE